MQAYFKRTSPPGFRLGKIVAFDEDLASQLDCPRGRGIGLRVVGGLADQDFTRREVGEDDLDGLQHGEAAFGGVIQRLANGVFENGDVGEAIVLGHSEVCDELADRMGGDAAPTEPGKCRHAGIIPPGDFVFLHKAKQFAFRNKSVAEGKFREFVLVGQGARQIERAEKPVVERPVIDEFERANAVGDTFEIIT